MQASHSASKPQPRVDDLWLWLSLLAIFLWTLIPIQGFDIWFYLEVGRQIVEEHHIPWTDSYLGTTDVYAFGRHANHAWISHAIFYLFYKGFGLPGLLALRSLLITSTAFFTYLNCRLANLSKPWSAVLILLGVFTMRSRFLLRSVLFTDLFLALLLFILMRFERTEGAKFPYFKLCALFVFWTNTHQGVSIGGICLFLWLITRKLSPKVCFAALLTGGVSTLVRPYGWWYPWFFTEHFGNSAAVRGVLEWTPLGATQVFKLLGPLLLVTALCVAGVVYKKTVPWGDLVFGLIFLGLALRSQRAVGELLPVFIPTLAALLARLNPSRKLLLPSLLCLSGLFYGGWLGVPWSRMAELDPKYPEGLIAELPVDHGQIFNSYEFGGYLIFRRQAPFIHGTTALFQEQLVLDFYKILNGGPERNHLLEQFKVSEAMIHHPTADDSTEGFLKFLADSPEWHLHWWDDSGYYFRKGESHALKAVKPWEKKPWTDPSLALNELNFMLERRPSGLAYYLRGQLRLEKGELQEALHDLKLSLSHTPDYYPALLAAGTTSFRLQDFPRAQTYLKQAVRVNPTAIAHFNLGLLLVQTGRAGEARGHLEKALEAQPNFTPARDLLEQIP